MSDLTILAPLGAKITDLDGQMPVAVCQPSRLAFLQEFSNVLLSHQACRVYPELVALGFWLRAANLKPFLAATEGHRKALGTVVHFTPANVDTMFIYSWVCALIMGNNNIIRVASQASAMRDQLFAVLNDLFTDEAYNAIGKSNLFVHYDKASDWTASLSMLADARLIWGGDNSVQGIRAYACKPRCRDISFADRYSIAVINADSAAQSLDIEALASRLWRDIQPYEQQACSSPRLLYWLGSEQTLASLLAALDKLALTSQPPIQRKNEQKITEQLLASTGLVQSILGENLSGVILSQFSPPLMDWHSGGNLLYIRCIASIDTLVDELDAKVQTLSHYGLPQQELLRLAENPSIKGVDRIVPVGQGVDFDLIWDGYDLMSQLSRQMKVIF